MGFDNIDHVKINWLSVIGCQLSGWFRHQSNDHQPINDNQIKHSA